MGAKSDENQTIMTLKDKLRRIRVDFQNCFTVCASVAKEYKREPGEKTLYLALNKSKLYPLPRIGLSHSEA